MAAAPLARRQFLVLSSAGLLLAGYGRAWATGTPGADAAGLVQRFLAIAPDGVVTVFAKHLDMGQGIWSGLAAIVAEELDVDWSQVRVAGAPAKIPDYAHTLWGVQTTGGSTSIAESWDQLRQAGAVARAMIVGAAADRWQVDPAEIAIADGLVSCGRRSAGLGSFAAAAARRAVPTDAVPKDPSRYRLLGRDRPRLDLSAKTRGQTRYGIDTDWPGIKAVVVAHAPRFGATLVGFDDTATRALAGVVAVVRIPSGVAVIGDTTWHALRGRAALIMHWDESHVERRSTETLFHDFTAQRDREPATVTTQDGDPDAVLRSGGGRIVEASFEFPYLAHAAMEPLAVAGRLADGACYLRGGFQAQTANQATVAAILNLPIERVFLDTVPAGGSFGRRAYFGPDWIDELAQVLGATGGRWPLKLFWSRDDDLCGGHYRPQMRHHYRASLAADGRVLALDHAIVGQSCFPAFRGSTPLPTPSDGVAIGHFAGQYACDSSRLAWWEPQVGVPTHTYRAVTNNHCGVSKEIFVDRLARAVGADPVAYRLALLSREPRQQAVLRLAAERIGWATPPPAGRMRGVAVHRADDSVIAQIVELSGTPAAFHVERVVTAVDCGRVIDPDTVRAQIEGGIGFGLSSVLYQQIRLDETGRVIERNFNDYRILRISEMPRAIETHLFDSPADPSGIGEPGSVPVAAAVVNALERMGHAPIGRFPVIGGQAA